MLKDEIVKWLRDYCLKANKSGFVIGVSGGIDSAVASTLCAETGLDVVIAYMPINNYEPNAVKHIKWLSDKYINVYRKMYNISDAYEKFVKLFPEGDNMTMANLKSRLRMVTLYAVASEKDLLVCGTGNKVEDFGVGFYTKYGDGGVDISPIGDCMKSEVYQMGREFDISFEIMEASPSDGLWEDGRTDEEQLGATYDELEWAMTFKFDRDLTDREGEVLDIYNHFHTANKHKMEEIPVFKKN